jgi:putative membrane protein
MKIFHAVAVLGLVTGAAQAGSLSKQDADFFNKAGAAGIAEVEAGKVAAAQASDPAVKDFANQMVTDHTAANDKLKALAESKGATLPAAPTKEQAAALDKIKAKSGAAFDDAYMDRMVKDHREAVGLFEKTAKGSKDPDIKSFVEETLPTLKHHDEMAKSLDKGLDKKSHG